MKTYILRALLLTAILAASFSFAQTLSGSFVGVDESHQASGSFKLFETGGERSLEFSEDFAATRGPDLFIWLVKGDNTENFVNLGRLQSVNGAQSYLVPEDVKLDEFDRVRVIVWCRLFRFLFATAEFQIRQ